MTDLELASEIARRAHAGQKDRGGHDYVTHPQAVADKVGTETQKVVAMLHDVAENTPVTLGSLRVLFGDEIAGAVGLLTHADGIGYMDYVAAIRGNPLAEVVKNADLEHNMELSRLSREPSDADRRRLEKYRKALELLNEKTRLAVDGQ